MGNRAVITFSGSNLGIYLHWNGGRDSVEAFLEYAKLKGYRGNCFVDLVAIVYNFLGSSCEVNTLDKLDCDNGDNGLYVIGNNLDIIGRKYFCGFEQKDHCLLEMLEAINESQPENMQLDKDFFRAKIVNRDNLKIGDKVYKYNRLDCKYDVVTVVGFGANCVNGTEVNGVPYVDLYNNKEKNINNYLLENSYRIFKIN